MSDLSRRNYFKKIAHLEGISFLLLLGIAMPLKYMADIPEAVKYTGWAHGILFIWYMAVVATYSTDMKWPLTKRALAVFAGLFPFGTFWFTRKMM